MAKMIRLDPAPKEALPGDGWELIATEAGRYPNGLRATLQVWNGKLQGAQQLALAHPQSWSDFATEVAAQTGGAAEEIMKTLLTLTAGIEGVLREAEAQAEARARSQATEMVELAADAELFHSPDGEAFGTFAVADHRETYPFRSKAFRRWLARRFYQEHEKAPGSQALQDTVTVLEGKALFDGPEYPVYTRLAEHEGVIYLDLADADWRTVKITPDGWQVVDESPVKFRRPRGMLPLPCPVRGGCLDDLRQLFNIKDDQAWILLKGFLVQLLNPEGPYPALIFHGEQGSAKSTQCRMVRALIDPSTAPLRAAPRDGRDLIIAATNGWVIALDNLSSVSDWLSDAICRLATGGGFATRELYSDGEEALFNAERPVILNGIEELATRGDLLDRAIVIYLPSIPEEQRRPEATLWRDFDAQHPKILGALLDAVSRALRDRYDVKLERLPRMADFAIWVAAASKKLGMSPDDFMDAYTGNRSDANELALDAALIVPPLRDLLAAKGEAWQGTATELLQDLHEQADERTRTAKGWPSNGRSLSNALRRVAPNLRQAGVDVTFLPGRRKGRFIHIEEMGIFASPSSPPSPPLENQLVKRGRTADANTDEDANAHGEDAMRTQTTSDVSPRKHKQGDAGDDGDAKSHTHSKRKDWTFPRRRD